MCHALLLLGFASRLTQSSSTDIDVHLFVDRDGQWAVHTRDVLDEPQHERVAPPRSVGVGSSLVAAKTNLAKSRLDKRTDSWDQKCRASDFAHCGSYQMAQNQVDVNIIIAKLR